MNKITVVIMCYGLYGYEYRTPEEVEGLIDYFYSCAQYIKALHKRNRLSGIVLCGGFTNSQYPDVSEADTSARYLLNLLKTVYKVPVEEINVCLEKQSYNTAQNIVFTGYMMTNIRQPFSAKELINVAKNDPSKAEEILQQAKVWGELSHNVVFICDKHQWLKVNIMTHLASPLLRHQLLLNVKSFPRQHIHSNSSWFKQLGAALVYLFDPCGFYADLKVGQEQ